MAKLLLVMLVTSLLLCGCGSKSYSPKPGFSAAEGWILWLELREGSQSVWTIVEALPSYQACVATAKHNARGVRDLTIKTRIPMRPIGMSGTYTGDRILEMAEVSDNMVHIVWQTQSGKRIYEYITYKCFPPNFDPRKQEKGGYGGEDTISFAFVGLSKKTIDEVAQNVIQELVKEMLGKEK